MVEPLKKRKVTKFDVKTYHGGTVIVTLFPGSKTTKEEILQSFQKIPTVFESVWPNKILSSARGCSKDSDYEGDFIRPPEIEEDAWDKLNYISKFMLRKSPPPPYVSKEANLKEERENSVTKTIKQLNPNILCDSWHKKMALMIFRGKKLCKQCLESTLKHFMFCSGCGSKVVVTSHSMKNDEPIWCVNCSKQTIKWLKTK
jgi:DNA-directed RNA polymerase subunit RPC12/RpoP